MLPAANLANMIQTSSSTYEFQMPNIYTRWVPLSNSFLQDPHCTLVDIKTRKTLKFESKILADEHGVVGDFIISLDPGLYRQNAGKDKTHLHSTSFLVELHRPPAKRQ